MLQEALCVKTEAEVQVKEEVSDNREAECENSADLRDLYADHVIKDELVLGPVELHRRCVPSILPAAPNRAEETFRKACSVRLERLDLDTEHNLCRVGLHTYKLTRPEPQNRMPAPSSVNRNGPMVHKRIKKIKKIKNIYSEQQKNNQGVRPPDSDSDDAATPAKRIIVVKRVMGSRPPVGSPVKTIDGSSAPVQPLPIVIREKRFRNMVTMFPEVSPMFIKNTLVKHGWNEERSRDELLEHDPETNERAPTSSSYQGARPGFSGQIFTAISPQGRAGARAAAAAAASTTTAASGRGRTTGSMTGQDRLTDTNEPAKTNECQVRAQEKREVQSKENTEKSGPFGTLQASSTSSQEFSLTVDVQAVPPGKPAVSNVIDRHDSNAITYKCDQRGKDFDMKSELEKHIQTHELLKMSKSLAASKGFTCIKCSSTFETKLSLAEHAKSRHEENYFACSECEYVTWIKKGIQRHLRRHTVNYKCGQCSVEFKWKSHLKIHLRKHTGEKPYKCSQCKAGFTASSTLKIHLRTHTGEKPYKCSQCKTAFVRGDQLKTHLRRHAGEKRYKCSLCNACFAINGDLRRHLRIHTGEKPYKCSQCEAEFTQSGHLKIHLSTHSGEKPYKCSQCKSGFTSSSTLKIHLRTHSGEKPYKCSQCKVAFAQSGALKRHLRLHTGEKPFECNICEYKTTRSSSLEGHLLRRHSGKKPFGCDKCSYWSSTRKCLLVHMKNHHKQV